MQRGESGMEEEEGRTKNRKGGVEDRGGGNKAAAEAERREGRERRVPLSREK